jgi:hypothetical protein
MRRVRGRPVTPIAAGGTLCYRLGPHGIHTLRYMIPQMGRGVAQAARGPRALETVAQEDFVVTFASATSGARF